jgi:hypothetical protein
MDGTADNYIAGNVYIGTNAGSNSLIVSKNITGGVDASGIRSSGTIQSDVTNSAYFFRAVVNQNAFALTTLVCYESQPGTISGTGGVLINFRANTDPASYGSVYGFQSNIAAGVNRFGLFFSGTAANYIEGDVRIGSSVSLGGHKLEVLGNIYGTTLVGVDALLMASGGVITRVTGATLTGLLTGSFIENQIAAAQATSQFWISGRGVVGTTDQPTYKFVIDSGTTTGNGLYVNGLIFATDNVVSFSDKTLKENITNLKVGNQLQDFKIKSYNRIGTTRKDIGVIAQDLQKYYPELVFSEGGKLAVNYSGVATLALGLSIETKNEIEILKKKIALLEKKL